jgi:hypothetical protein
MTHLENSRPDYNTKNLQGNPGRVWTNNVIESYWYVYPLVKFNGHLPMEQKQWE